MSNTGKVYSTADGVTWTSVQTSEASLNSLSYGAGVRLVDGDIMEVAFTGFGRPLRNPLRVLTGPAALVTVKPFE